jgi:hypothetical protein
MEVLESLINKRIAWLNEESKNATVACVITITKSLRADTRRAAWRNKSKITDTGHYAFFDGRERRWKACTDWKMRSKALVNLPPFRFVDLRGVKPQNAHVYKVDAENKRTYYVAAASIKRAKEFEKAAAKKRILRYRGLARHTLSVVMSKLAQTTIPASADGEGEVKRKASELAKVKVTETKNGCTCSMTSGIDYGKRALKSGSVDLAVKKAANKIAGQLKRAATSQPFIASAPPTPFPEVAKRRK